MYADGDGVKQNHQLAFEYFGGIADSHAEEPRAPRRRASSPTPL
jgi:TPR repeat protein